MHHALEYPALKLRILRGKQFREQGLLVIIRQVEMIIEVAFQHKVELQHAASALPAKLFAAWGNVHTVTAPAFDRMNRRAG